MSTYSKALKLYAPPDPDAKFKKSKTKTKRFKTRSFQENNLDEEATTNKNTLIDFFFELQRREHDAATLIKRAWKRTRILLPWRHAVRMMQAVVTIQKHMRGCLARKFVARWYLTRIKTIIELESRVRRHLCNKYLRPHLAFEQKMAITMQRYIRGYYGRKRHRFYLSTLAVIRIQALWRGVCARTKADKIWINRQVIVIQNAMRRKLAVNTYRHATNKLYGAATKIQKQFRLFSSVRTVSDKLHKREMKYRNDILKALAMEEDHCVEKMHYIMNRCVKQQIREKAVNHQKLVLQKEDEIYKKEMSLIELTNQKETLSPRAIEQGFDVALNTQLLNSRNDLSTLKLNYMFDMQLEQFDLDFTLEVQVQELEEFAAHKKHITLWRNQEYEDRRHLYYQRDIMDRRNAKRLSVAEERRKWQVRYYTSDGKPDKRRRPGRPWDRSVYANADKATYSSGTNVDLLAFNHIHDQMKEEDKKIRSAHESASDAVNKVSLNTYLDQMRVYEQLLQPIQNILSEHAGVMAQPDPKKYEQMGYGQLGHEYANALIGLGVEPEPEKVILKHTELKKPWKERLGLPPKLIPPPERPKLPDGKHNVLGTIKKLSNEDSSSSKKRVSFAIENSKSRSPSSSAKLRQEMFSLEPGSTSTSTMPLLPSLATVTQDSSQEQLPSEADSLALATTATRRFQPRSWKKPYKPLFPTEDSFAEYFPTGETCHTDQVAKFDGPTQEELEEQEREKQKLQNALGLQMQSLYGTSSSSRKKKGKDKDRKKNAQEVEEEEDEANEWSIPKNMKGTKSLNALVPLGSPQGSINSIDEDSILQEVLEREFQQKLKHQQERQEMAKRRKERKSTKRQIGVIPWNLLDAIDGHEKRFESEKTYAEFYHRF